MQNQLGIDMGSATLCVAMPERGLVLKDPSVIAVDRETGRVIAAGASAEQKLNSADRRVSLTRPFANGFVGSHDEIRAILSSTLAATGSIGADLILSVPCDISDDDEETIGRIAQEAGAATCHLVYAPLAALAGTFLRLPAGCLTVDIGATSTNVMLLCRGRIYYMKTIRVGGQTFDRSIADFLWKRKKVRVSLRTAESIKMKIGSVWAGATGRTMEAMGKDAAGREVKFRVTSAELYDSLEQPLSAILEAVFIAVSKIPSEFVSGVFELGIQLAGGGALLDGIDHMIGGVTGVPTMRVDDPIGCTALGLAEMFDILPSDLPPTFRNVSEIYIKHAGLPGQGEYHE